MNRIHEDIADLAVPIDDLHPYFENARIHDLDVIGDSLRVNGQYKPIVVNRGTLTGRPSEILAGNGTWEAAKAKDWTEIAVSYVDVDNDLAARINLIDNRANDLAGYDEGLLAKVLAARTDLEGTGWSTDARDELLKRIQPAELPAETDADSVPAPPPAPVTKPGDVWRLGPHRLICGDCRDHDTVATLLDGAAINMAFTSPPYADARTYDAASGFVPILPDEYVDWFEDVQANVRAHLADDGSWFVNIKAKAEGLDTPLYVLDLVAAHVRRWGWHWATEFCWERIGMPKSVTRRFKNQFEPIYEFRRGEVTKGPFEPVYQFAAGPWKMRPEAVMHPTDSAVAAQGEGAGDTGWGDHLERRGFAEDRVGPGMAYPGNRLPPFASEHTGHTAAFPVGLPAWFMRAFTDRGDVVFDPFMGAGSTLIAAHQEGRVAYGVELSPAYCDVICRRYEDVTGDAPVLDSTGLARSFR